MFIVYTSLNILKFMFQYFIKLLIFYIAIYIYRYIYIIFMTTNFTKTIIHLLTITHSNFSNNFLNLHFLLDYYY